MRILAATMLLAAALGAGAQSLRLFERPVRGEIYNFQPVDTVVPGIDVDAEAGIAAFFDGPEPAPLDVAESLTYVVRPMSTRLETYNLRPMVFDYLRVFDGPMTVTSPRAVEVVTTDPAAFDWLNEEMMRSALLQRARQQYLVDHPDLIRFNENLLPEPPREFTAVIDPETAAIVLREVVATEAPKPELDTDFRKRHWLRKFSGDLQFSQAYVSPNWYQGGNNNLNALLNLYYQVKLNPAFHPKWIFDNTFQYKLGMNNAPDDELRDYSISEDIFQWNMTAGYKSAKRWYYSLSAMFKTQMLNNYKSNTNDLKAAFLSPGELNVGIGMTYAYTNPKKTVTFDASISPLSWNMKTCINHHMNPTSYGIKAGRKVVNEIGSSAEGKLSWTIASNISLRSRLFVFTDYDYLQSDWENTIQFNVNRFLSTQIYVHARYDSTTKRPDENTDWHKFQLKEILSFGFSYKFGTL